MTQIIRAILLGILQGLTEYIPVSSSAHLVIVPWLFGWNDPGLTSLTFDVALHLGTLLAVVWYFAADWLAYIKAGIASIRERRIGADHNRRLAWVIVLGSLPGAIAGMLFESRIADLFHPGNGPIKSSAMIAMGGIIAFLGVLLFIADRYARRTQDLGDVGWARGGLIGIAQALAIFPGVSRSGATITAGLALGLKRDVAARFSFLLSAPIIFGAGLKSCYSILKNMQNAAIPSGELVLFPIGFVAAAVSGYFCIRFVLHYLQKHSLSIFAYYRWGLALLIIIVAVARG
jgi:undecaprenyl-diphosphatase